MVTHVVVDIRTLDLGTSNNNVTSPDRVYFDDHLWHPLYVVMMTA